MKKYILFILFGIFINSYNGKAQELLSLSQAINYGLENNHQVLLSEMEADIASRQLYKSNVGMAPRLDWNVNLGSAYNNVNQEFVDGRVINRLGRTIAPNTNLALSYTLYDGGKMKSRYNILEKNSEFSKVVTEMSRETVINNITLAYLRIAKQIATLEYLNNNIKYYRERLKITKERWDVGRGSKLDFLQSENDLNSQLIQIENANNNLQNFKEDLKVLMNKASDYDFVIEPMLENVVIYTKDELVAKALKDNEEIQMLNLQSQINQLEVKDLEGNKKPRIGVNANLGYSLSNTNAGLILLNQNLGVNGLVTSTWNLLDGKHNNNQVNITKQRSKLIDMRIQEVESRIKSACSIALNQFNSFKKTLDLEKSNKALAQENLDIALEKFKLGASSILELNDAQQRLDNALNRNVEAFFNLKQAEVNILALIQ